MFAAASQSKDDSLCIIPECTRPKYKDPSGKIEYDCCGKSHAEEAKKRNIERKFIQGLIMITDMTMMCICSYSHKHDQCEEVFSDF